MDLPYSQQHLARRKQRSAGSLQHLSLAPLTTRLPLEDHPIFDVSDYPPPVTSYLQGRSAPVTPRLLSTSPPPLGQANGSRAHSRNLPGAKNGRKRGMRTSAAADDENGIAGATGSTGRAALPKSRSTTHLLGPRRHLLRHGQRWSSIYGEEEKDDEEDNGEGTDEWLFRAGALVTSETREFKGQSWLTARASSTSLAGLRGLTEADGDNATSERERRRRAADGITSSSVYGSRRGSIEHLQHLVHQQHVLAANGFASQASSLMGSRRHSRTGSRTRSRVGSQMQLHHLREARGSEGTGSGIDGNGVSNDCVEEVEDDDDDARYGGDGAPDFVHLDKRLEALQLHGGLRQEEADEDQIRRLVKREKAGGIIGGWLGSVLGWPLFSVQGGDDDDDDDDENEESGIEEGFTDEEAEGGEGDDNAERSEEARSKGQAWRNQRARRRARAYFEGGANPPAEHVPPPPETDEGTWKDAAWLLSVASKVLF